MKIKNIMFSGFAAALFAGVCGAANAAAVELVSKPYADTNLQAKLTAGENIAIDQNTNTISATGLVTTTKLTEVQESLQNAINGKQEAGQYAAAQDLEDLKDIVDNLKGDSSETVPALAERVRVIENNYATDEEMLGQINEVKELFKNYYNKTEVDNLLNAKATTADLNALGTRVGTAEGKITAAEGKITTLEGAVATKAEADSVYSKTAADAKFATQEFVGELPQGTTAENIVSFVEEKTANIVDNTEFEALDTRVETAEGEIDDLQAATANLSDFVDSEEIKAYSTTEQMNAAIEAAAYDDTALAGRVTQNESDIATNAGNISTNAGNISTNAQAIEALQDAGYQDVEGVKATVETYGYQTESQVETAISTATAGMVTGTKTAGSYLVNFDDSGNASYAPVTILNAQGAPIDLTTDAVK